MKQQVDQLTMFGTPIPAGDLAGLTPRQRAELLLDEDQRLRNDDRLLMLAWWKRFDNLDELFRWTLHDLLEGEVSDEELAPMAEALSERFGDWFQRMATSPETIRRRRQEIQSNRNNDGAMRGSPHTTAYRRARDGAGPPRR